MTETSDAPTAGQPGGDEEGRPGDRAGHGDHSTGDRHRQLAIDFAPAAALGPARAAVLAVLRKAWPRWLTPSEIGDQVLRDVGTIYSDSTITARLRDLRKPRYGAHVIDVQRRAGRRSSEYRLATPEGGA